MSEYKIIVMGSGGVGKSALTIRFVQGIFVEFYDPTIEDYYKKNVNIDGKDYNLEIVDTAGTEQFVLLRDMYIKTGDAFVIVYSICSMATFNDVQPLLEKINLIKDSPQIPIVIVGNKCDLKDEREVSTSLGEELAKEYNCIFFECSAKSQINVNEIFLSCVRQKTVGKNKAPNIEASNSQISIDVDKSRTDISSPDDSSALCSNCFIL